ncbi:hypothetical protein PZA11_000152 [Diplocarpon coronariae]
MPVNTGNNYYYLKDMTAFDSLLREEQKISMQLDHTELEFLTGIFRVNVTALYYNDNDVGKPTPADLILPISPMPVEYNESVIVLPNGKASNDIVFPRNVERAVVSVFASGIGAEEFWFKNVPTEYEKTLENSVTGGQSSFREVKLRIDGNLAGVVWPSPTIYTGGKSPENWVPTAGTDVYDFPSFEIDVSPWLGSLCDSMPHKFELEVFGYDSEEGLLSIESDWWVSGSIFIWLDKDGIWTTGTDVKSEVEDLLFNFIPTISTFSGRNSSLQANLTAARTIHHSSNISTSSGSREIIWSQALAFQSILNFEANSYDTAVYHTIDSISAFSLTKNYRRSDQELAQNSYTNNFYLSRDHYPQLNLTSGYSTIVAEVDQSREVAALPLLFYLTNQNVFREPVVQATIQVDEVVYSWNDTHYQHSRGKILPRILSTRKEQNYKSYGPISDGRTILYDRGIITEEANSEESYSYSIDEYYYNSTVIDSAEMKEVPSVFKFSGVI